MSEFFSERQIKRTRKPHRCQWCAELVAAGAAAVYQAGMGESDFFAQYLHPECGRASRKYFKEHDEPYYPDEPMPRGGIDAENDCAEPLLKDSLTTETR